MIRRVLVLAFVAVLVVLAPVVFLYAASNCGAFIGGGNWGFAVFAYDDTGERNGSFVFHGLVYVDGSTGAPRIHDVRLVFYDRSGRRLESVSLGDFGVDAQRRRNVTVSLPRRPVRVELHGRVETDPDSDWAVVGLQWNGKAYENIELQQASQPWYC